MSVETARRWLWRAVGDTAGFSEQGAIVGYIRVIPEPWLLTSCPFLILKSLILKSWKMCPCRDILQGSSNWEYLLPRFYEDRQTSGPVRRQHSFGRRTKWGKCLARSVNLILVSIFFLNVRASEAAGIQSSLHKTIHRLYTGLELLLWTFSLFCCDILPAETTAVPVTSQVSPEEPNTVPTSSLQQLHSRLWWRLWLQIQ